MNEQTHRPFGVKQSIDDTLMGRIAKGDKEALQELYDCICGSVYGFALSIVKNPQDADDVLQETFIRVYVKAADYIPRGKPLSWIFTIVRHLSMDKLREKGSTYPLEEAIPVDQLRNVADADCRMALENLLTHLADEERQIIILHTIQGLTFREIAGVLDRPFNTVLSKYYRGIKRLKSLAEEGHYEK